MSNLFEGNINGKHDKITPALTFSLHTVDTQNVNIVARVLSYLSLRSKRDG